VVADFDAASVELEGPAEARRKSARLRRVSESIVDERR
jgi:hypothetical protein